MIYSYFCEKCQENTDAEFEMGKAAKEIKCKCGNMAYRDFNCNFKCYGPSANMKFKKDMKKKNENAARNMRKTWEGTQPKFVQQ